MERNYTANDITEPYSCAKIIEGGILFEVPIYQRLFVWGEAQIERLLNDVKEALKKQFLQYYIGVVTVKRSSGDKDVGGVWELVDGQQRNTFLTLFAAECISRGMERWVEFVFTNKNRSALRIKYNGRHEDELDIRALANGTVAEISNKNFIVFHRVFTRWFGSLDEEHQKCVENYFFTKVAFFVSELPSDYKPSELNLYFERMNAAGQQLGLLDVVKGRFFPNYSARIDAALHFGGGKFEVNVSDLDNGTILGAILDDSSDPSSDEEKTDVVKVVSVISPELMMLHALSKVEGLQPNKVLSDERKIVSFFQEYFSAANEGRHDNNAKRFLDELERYRQWIDNNLVYIDLESDERVYRFRSVDADPNDYQQEDEDLLTDTKEDTPHAVERLRQFESMLYVSHPSGEAWAYSAYCHFYDRDKVSRSELLYYLMKWDRDNEELPILRELNYAQIERRWFWRLDYLLWDQISFPASDGIVPLWMPQRLLVDDLCKSAIRKYTFRSNRSIEHLHPQTATDANELERSQWERQYDGIKAEDSFGNLAMISSSFNSQQSNDQINVKLARIKDQIRENRIESIKMVVMASLTAGDDIRNWTVAIAKDHGEKMYELLQSAYGGSCGEPGQEQQAR